MRPVAVAVGAAGLAALLGAGYLANEWRICSGLEESYLNSVAGMKGNIAIRSFMTEPDTVAAVDRLQEHEIKKIEGILTSLHQQCGERSADTAVRKGQELLLGR